MESILKPSVFASVLSGLFAAGSLAAGVGGALPLLAVRASLAGTAAGVPRSEAEPKPELVIYTYDSFVSKSGAGPEIFPRFEASSGCKIKAVSVGKGGQLAARLQLDAERKKTLAHVVLGLDQHAWEQAKPWAESWGEWRPAGFERIDPELKISGKAAFLPFDYGAFAFIADTHAPSLAGSKLRQGELPRKLDDLLDPRWKRNLILQDPRTSTPGMALLLYTRAVLGEKAWSFWGGLRSQWLTLAPGWDAAYGLFLKKEAPLVWSYITSQAYHVEHGDRQGRYRAVLFEEGQPIQIEGAAWVKGALKSEPLRRCAREFLAFLISPETQSTIARKNWMMPVRKDVVLPESFRSLPVPGKLHRIEVTADELASALKDWRQAIQGQ